MRIKPDWHLVILVIGGLMAYIVMGRQHGFFFTSVMALVLILIFAVYLRLAKYASRVLVSVDSPDNQ